jgi:hypothetical protein
MYMPQWSIGGIGVELHPLLNSELDGFKSSVLGPGCFTAVPTALEVMWAMNLAAIKKKKSLALLGTET